MEKKDEIKLELIILKKQIKAFLDNCDLEDGLRSGMAEQIINEAVLWGAKNLYESIGILAHAQIELVANFDIAVNELKDISNLPEN